MLIDCSIFLKSVSNFSVFGVCELLIFPVFGDLNFLKGLIMHEICKVLTMLIKQKFSFVFYSSCSQIQFIFLNGNLSICLVNILPGLFCLFYKVYIYMKFKEIKHRYKSIHVSFFIAWFSFNVSQNFLFQSLQITLFVCCILGAQYFVIWMCEFL